MSAAARASWYAWMARILIVEDEPSIALALEDDLRREGASCGSGKQVVVDLHGRMSMPRRFWFTSLIALTMAIQGCSSGNSRTPVSPSPTPGPAPTSPPTPVPDVFYTAIGASDAVGVGASVICIPLAPCPDGTGYVPIIARRLATGRTVTLTNLGITTGFGTDEAIVPAWCGWKAARVHAQMRRRANCKGGVRQ